MLIPILTISSLVHIYALGYMSHDPHQTLINYDVDGLIYGIIIIIIAGAESAIGLSILVSYYRLRGHINIENNNDNYHNIFTYIR